MSADVVVRWLGLAGNFAVGTLTTDHVNSDALAIRTAGVF
jgi:hypothetical protein